MLSSRSLIFYFYLQKIFLLLAITLCELIGCDANDPDSAAADVTGRVACYNVMNCHTPGPRYLPQGSQYPDNSLTENPTIN